MSSSLQGFQPFDSLSAAALEELSPKLAQKTFPKDSYVFTQGQRSLGYLFLVVSGLAEIIIRSDAG